MITLWLLKIRRLFCCHEAHNRRIINIYFDKIRWKDYLGKRLEKGRTKIKFRCGECAKVMLKTEDVVRSKENKKLIRIGEKFL